MPVGDHGGLAAHRPFALKKTVSSEMNEANALASRSAMVFGKGAFGVGDLLRQRGAIGRGVAQPISATTRPAKQTKRLNIAHIGDRLVAEVASLEVVGQHLGGGARR